VSLNWPQSFTIRNAFVLGLVGTLGVGVGLFILLAIGNLATVITYVGVALFLALGLDPSISWLEQRRMPRWVAILTVVIVLAAILTSILLIVIPVVVSQITQFSGQLPKIFEKVVSGTWLTALQQQFPFLAVDKLVSQLNTWATGLLTPDKVSEVAGGVLQVAVAVGGGLFSIVIVFILTIYFTASLTAFKQAAYLLVPKSKRERFADITEQITHSVGRYVLGQASLAAINAVASFIFLTIISAPFPAALAVIAGLFSLIPLVGTLSGSVLIVLTCLIPTLGTPLTALIAAIYYIIYMQVEAYILTPRIMQHTVKVPGAVVVIAALAGGTLLGILGALIAIPCAAAIMLIVKQVVVPRQESR